MHSRFNLILISFIVSTIFFNTNIVETISFAESSKSDVKRKAFGDQLPKAKKHTLWLNKHLQSEIKLILDHPYPKLRLRYWSLESDNSHAKKIQTLWFLDEIGKDKPISFAISVINNHIQFLEVIKFRESRGGEIQLRQFKDQFIDVGLSPYQELDLQIDGISGATMSVSASKKVAELALFLHQYISNNVRK